MDTQQTLERLSTGRRVNTGKDDPAGLIAASNLKRQLRSERQASENAQRVTGMTNVIDGALGEMQPILLDIQRLVHEASSDATPDQIEANQNQIDQGLRRLFELYGQTTFNGKSVFRTLPPPEGPAAIDFVANPVVPFWAAPSGSGDGQNGHPTSATALSPSTLQLDGNAWKASILNGNYTVTPNTTLSFEFEVNSPAEIHGVAFENDNNLVGSYNRLIQFFGTQGSSGWNVHPDTYPGSGWYQYDIKPDDYGIAGFNRVVFVNDDDTTPIIASGKFRNVKLYEDVPVTDDGKVRHTFSLGTGGPRDLVELAFDPPNPAKLGSTVASLTDLRFDGSHSLDGGLFEEAFEAVEEAIRQIAELRGTIGGFQRGIVETSQRNAETAALNLTDAIGTVEDADFAIETASLSRSQTLEQASLQTRRRGQDIRGQQLLDLVQNASVVG